MRLSRSMETWLQDIVIAETNAYALANGIQPPFPDDITPEHFAGLTEEKDYLGAEYDAYLDNLEAKDDRQKSRG